MTLLSQISTLQGQQEALESRLGSLSQTSDNAMDREREAEDRLDAALSLHAKQISQRQVSAVVWPRMNRPILAVRLPLQTRPLIWFNINT
jgi:outer membrane murein-binding lipoprotein Lpp